MDEHIQKKTKNRVVSHVNKYHFLNETKHILDFFSQFKFVKICKNRFFFVNLKFDI